MSEPKTRRPRILRGETPTDPMPMVDLLRRTPYRHARIPDAAGHDDAVRQGIELAARVGELMLRCGAGGPQVEGAVAAVAAAAGVDRVELDITLQSVLIQARSSDGQRHTLLRVVRRSRFDYARIVAVHRLVQSLVAGECTVTDARMQLREIARHPRLFPVWAVAVANVVLASSVAVLIGAGALAAVVTAAVVLAVQGVARTHSRLDLPEFYANAINAFAATMFAGLFFTLGRLEVLEISERDFAFIVAGGIVAMLPGRTMASAIEDVLFGYPLTGAGRLLNVMLSLTGLIIGIAAGLGILLTLTESSGASFVSPAVLDLRVTEAPLVPALLASLLVGLAAAVTVQSRHRLIVPVGVLTLLGVVVSSVLTRVLDIGTITATGLAAVTVGLVGRFVAQRVNAPSMVFVVPASFGLLPGLTIFRGLYEMVATGSDAGTLSIQAGITTLLGAGAVLLAIATGTVLGDLLASPWDRRMRGPLQSVADNPA